MREERTQLLRCLSLQVNDSRPCSTPRAARQRYPYHTDSEPLVNLNSVIKSNVVALLLLSIKKPFSFQDLSDKRLHYEISSLLIYKKDMFVFTQNLQKLSSIYIFGMIEKNSNKNTWRMVTHFVVIIIVEFFWQICFFVCYLLFVCLK